MHLILLYYVFNCGKLLHEYWSEGGDCGVDYKFRKITDKRFNKENTTSYVTP